MIKRVITKVTIALIAITSFHPLSVAEGNDSLGFSANTLVTLGQRWQAKENCMTVTGEFEENGKFSGDEKMYLTRKHKFQASIQVGFSSKIYIELLPAMTLVLDSPTPYSFWNARIAYDGTNWITSQSPPFPDLDILNKEKNVWLTTISYVPPAELGRPGESLLWLDYLLPWKMSLSYQGAGVSLIDFIKLPTTSIKEFSDRIEVTNEDACTKRNIVFEKKDQLRLRSIKIVGNICAKDKEQQSMFETTITNWESIGEIGIPKEIIKKISLGDDVRSITKIFINKIQLNSGEYLNDSIKKASSDLNRGAKIFDERTGNRYILEKDGIRMEGE